ncbi:MAG: family 16 glycosylhydrolase [Salinivirgaceae bacterium]
MRKLIPLEFLLSFLFLFLFANCADEPVDTSLDPENLTVEILSISKETKEVKLQASALNVTQYKFYVEAETEPEETNTSGIFTHVFPAYGQYEVSVRAYGASGKYLKTTVEIRIDIPEELDVSIDQGYFTPTTYEGYTLVWNDEFEGTSINTNDWVFEKGAGGWGNNELQYYRSENTSVGGGLLTIEAKKEAYQGSSYTSSRITTQGKKTFQYGRVDIRALLPKGQGIWPALWMLGANITSVGWPACGEIDIMEMIGGAGRENQTHGTLHWDLDGHVQAGGSNTLSEGTFADAYHVFTLIWDAYSMKWYVDDVLFHQIDITPSHMSEFHAPHFFIFNVAVGGNWPGYPDASTLFPQKMRVDYIRVFQPN